MWVQRPYDPTFCEHIVSRAAVDGLHLAEIAAELGVSIKDFEAWAGADDAFAVAMADADTQAQAWWWAQPRLALHAAAPFRAAAWSKAMAQRFGRSAHSTRRIKPDDAKPPVVLARYEIPDNGRPRRSPKAGRGGG